MNFIVALCFRYVVPTVLNTVFLVCSAVKELLRRTFFTRDIHYTVYSLHRSSFRIKSLNLDNVWVYIQTKQDCGEWTMFGYIYIQSRTAVERLTSTMHLVKLDVYIHSTYTLIFYLFFKVQPYYMYYYFGRV